MRIRCRSPPARDAGGEETESGSTVSSAQSSSATVPKKKTRRSRPAAQPGKEYKCGHCGRIFSTGTGLGGHMKSHSAAAALGRQRKKVPLAPERTAEEGDSVVLHGGGSEKLEGGWPAEGIGMALGGHRKGSRNAAAPLLLDLNSPPPPSGDEEEEGGLPATAAT
ncbi:unnamed protein product [Spirodela intermedia]|uniref:C2H2-type domain-containing protein n=1 Tax=Spirodela intermedia TaxID=51605 RepID=A0A7I8LKQ1_SPIIN|nr:unnamed protein product [Spirodela intermedia]